MRRNPACNYFGTSGGARAFFMKSPNYVIEFDVADHVVIRDIGPWDAFQTVTNGAEDVVKRMAQMLSGRRLLYYDSDGEFGELLVKDGLFAGFA